jgi:hypothetical protein
MTVAVPLLAGGLLALAEALFSVRQSAGDPTSARVAWIAAVGLGGVFASAVVLIAAAPHVGRSVWLTAAGTAAAVLVVAVLGRAWMPGGRR